MTVWKSLSHADNAWPKADAVSPVQFAARVLCCSSMLLYWDWAVSSAVWMVLCAATIPGASTLVIPGVVTDVLPFSAGTALAFTFYCPELSYPLLGFYASTARTTCSVP